jgi:Rne/Rng family ribonuclease
VTREVLVERMDRGYAAALVEGHELLDHVAAPDDGATQPGAIHLARVARNVPAIGVCFVVLGGGAPAALELGKSPPREGEAIVVQVTAPAAGDKPARVRRGASLDGHLVILRPGGRSIRMARRAAASFGSDAMTEALGMRLPEGMGLVVRSAAERAPDEAVASEIDRLIALWRAIEARSVAAEAPALLHAVGAPRRAVLPLLRARPGRVSVNDRAAHEACALLGVAATLEPDAKLFDRHEVAEQLARAQMPEVALAGGGSIALETTRALVAVDVDGGDRPAAEVNLAAARELARQLRLRELAGTVVVDFIRAGGEAQRRIERVLAEATALDRRRVDLLGWTRGGLYELRRGEAVDR